MAPLKILLLDSLAGGTRIRLFLVGAAHYGEMASFDRSIGLESDFDLGGGLGGLGPIEHLHSQLVRLCHSVDADIPNCCSDSTSFRRCILRCTLLLFRFCSHNQIRLLLTTSFHRLLLIRCRLR